MKRTGIIAFALLLVVGAGSAALLHADGERGRDRRGQRDRHTSPTPPNAGYEATCGACHFAYQPWLLPAASWEGLLAGLNDHFGEAVTTTAAQKQALRSYLLENAADKSTNKRARKMLKGLEGQPPQRITQLPCFQRKHSRLGAEVAKRASVGGLGNCPACHTTAAQGDYDDDNVKVPRQ